LCLFQPAASTIQLPWYLQKDSNGRDVPTLLKLLAVKDKMIDALLREKTQAKSSSASPSPLPPPPTLHATTQTLPPATTSTTTQCDVSACSPTAAEPLSLLHSVASLSP
jgi:hypothetical protein